MFRASLLGLVFFGFSFLYADVKVIFVDVGEGDSTIIITPNSKVVLIDTGNLYMGFKVYRLLKEKFRVNRISAIFLTHHHLDHIGGAFWLLQIMKVDRLYDNGYSISRFALSLPFWDDIFFWYEKVIRYANIKRVILKQGDRIDIDGVSFFILHPDKLYSDMNLSSLVIKMVYDGVSFLFMGDANKKVEEKLLKEYSSYYLRADVLKVGHHGAYDATGYDFIKTVSPKYAIISVDRRNRRGYPSKKVLKLLYDFGVKVFITYKQKDISFGIRKKEVKYLPSF